MNIIRYLRGIFHSLWTLIFVGLLGVLIAVFAGPRKYGEFIGNLVKGTYNKAFK